MSITACIDPPTATHRYADDCDVSSVIGAHVKVEDHPLLTGIVTKAWVKDGGLYAEIALGEGEGRQ